MSTGLSDIHPDIITTHLLPRLDGSELATVSCVSSTLRSLSTSTDLWSRICHDTWPSTNTPRLRQVISSFPNGPLSFFSLAFPLLHPPSDPHRPSTNPAPNTLISAVDLFYKGEPILSKTVETETGTGWLQSAPFRIDLLDTKDAVPTPIPCPALYDDACHRHLYHDLELSWILIDPIGRRALNVSSIKPVSVHRHWLTGELQAKFATVMQDGDGEEVLCVVEVSWAAVEAAEQERLTVREVGLEVEDVDGIRLSGKDSIEIIQRGWEWGRRRGRCSSTAEGDVRRKKYEEFMERRRERSERRTREEGFWDMLYISMAILFFAAFFSSLFCKR